MEMEFALKKCEVMEMGKGVKRPNWNYKIGLIARAWEEKDLDVAI